LNRLKILHKKDIQFREQVLADKEDRLKISYTKIINGLRNDIKKTKDLHRKAMDKTVAKYELKVDKLSTIY
jgi:hypothetical protein